MSQCMIACCLRKARRKSRYCREHDKAAHLRVACARVEDALRAIGRDVEIILLKDGVQIAPFAWRGCVVEDTLYEALTAAEKTR